MVGYRDPPTHSRFKPGQSGNSSGRPKGRRSLAQDIRSELDAIAPGQEISNQRLIACGLVERSLIGDMKAIALIAMLAQQHSAAGESDQVGEVDREIIGRFGKADPSSADQQPENPLLLSRPKAEAED
jgi:Family of unknown function (DUF5681)